MAVKIRLQRFGKRNNQFIKSLQPTRAQKRDGRNLEVVGQYSPNAAQISTFKDARVFYWLGVGAQPTDTVKNLLQKNGLWMRWALKKQKKMMRYQFLNGKMANATRAQSKKSRRKKKRRKVKEISYGSSCTSSSVILF